MVATASEKKRYTIEEYLRFEEQAEEKHEFHNGKIIPMAGASIPHNQIIVNVITTLRSWIAENKLDLFVLTSDVKVRIEAFNRNVYPDAIVICEKPEYWQNRKDTIVNPVLIFEILSGSTQGFDKKDKFKLYRSLPSLREYVLIDQFKPWVDTYFKKPEGENLWEINTHLSLNAKAPLQSIGFELPLSEVYWKIPELLGDEWETE